LSLAKPASYVPEIVTGVAQFCLQWKEAADGIIISGDIATSGIARDIATAKAFVDEPARSGFMSGSGFPTLSASGLPVYMMPGNHDRYLNDTAAPNSRTFDLAFGDYLRNFKDYVGFWVAEKGHARVAFVYADFSLRTKADAEFVPAYFAYGQGRVYDDVLQDLKDTTVMIRRDFGDVPVVWITHFAPFHFSRSLAFIDYQKITAAATGLGVLSTLCGHTHQSARHQIDTHVIYCGGSAGCADSADDSRVQIINIDVGETCRISRECYKWSVSQQEFTHYLSD
jgi:3',5'-cyclic AMP phosphodiesterase CpdA